jgi:hypothetical protein
VAILIPSDQILVSRVCKKMMCLRSSLGLAAAVVAISLAACGGLETPERGFGSVTGRIVGAADGSYVYPLGLPGLKISPAADGSFAITNVPAGEQQLVLWDGVDRAELASVAVVAGGAATLPDRYGAYASVAPELRMPFAGTVLAGVAPDGGAIAWGPAFSLKLTDLAALVPAAGGVISIYPLPGGTFDLAAALPGFTSGAAPVTVLAAATATVQVRLPIDLAAAAPGCGSAPGCESGLACNPVDGRCYACTATDSSRCATNEVCDTSTGLCKSTLGVAAVCSSCTADANCAPGVCIIASGATSGYCSHTCVANLDCPAGFYCGSTSKRCRAPNGCEAWLQTMAATCLGSERCEDALYNGRCEHAVGAPGYCTAACQSGVDCRIGSGTASTMSCNGGYCAL